MNIRYVKIFLLLFLSINNTIAQNYIARVEEYYKGWTIIDESENKKIEKTFGHLHSFNEGLAAYRDNSQWGYINTDGEVIIAAQYANVFHFSCGIAAVGTNQKIFHYIDKTGKTVSKYYFISVFPCTDSVYFAQLYDDSGYRLFNYEGEIISSPKTYYKTVTTFKNGYGVVLNNKNYWQIISTKGDVIYENKNVSYLKQATEGMFPFRAKGKWGFMNSTFNEVVPAIYDRYTTYKNGYAKVGIGSQNWLIDKAGVIMDWSKGYADVRTFSNELLPVKNSGNLWGCTNNKGEIIIPFNYKEIKTFSEGIALVKTSNGLWGYINNKGEWIIKPQLLGGKNCRNGFMLFKHPDLSWQFATKDGKILKGKYEHAYSFQYFGNYYDNESDEETEED